MSTTPNAPTPETDAARGFIGAYAQFRPHPCGDIVPLDFARRLERERDTMHRENAALKAKLAKYETPAPDEEVQAALEFIDHYASVKFITDQKRYDEIQRIICKGLDMVNLNTTQLLEIAGRILATAYRQSQARVKELEERGVMYLTFSESEGYWLHYKRGERGLGFNIGHPSPWAINLSKMLNESTAELAQSRREAKGGTI